MFKNTVFFNDFGEDRIVHFLRNQKESKVFLSKIGVFLVWGVRIRRPSKCPSYSEQIWMNFVFFSTVTDHRNKNEIGQRWSRSGLIWIQKEHRRGRRQIAMAALT